MVKYRGGDLFIKYLPILKDRKDVWFLINMANNFSFKKFAPRNNEKGNLYSALFWLVNPHRFTTVDASLGWFLLPQIS